MHENINKFIVAEVLELHCDRKDSYNVITLIENW
jgi:hypothetical protein